MLYVISIGSVIILLWLALQISEERGLEKERVKRILKIKQDYVLEGYNDILENANGFGNDFYESLNSYAAKMDKLSALKQDLKPYDVYEIGSLAKNCCILGRIVIDKNLNPKFMAVAQSLISEEADIQLDAAYSSDSVRELANKCRRIKLDIDIDNYRKDRVKKAING